MENNFEILKWDSDFFNFKVAKINDFSSEDSYFKMVDELKQGGVKLAYCFSVPDSFMDKILKKDNVFLADEKITFSHLINKGEIDLPEVNIKEFSEGVVTDKMLDIAIQTSEHSRFRVDNNFKNEEFKKLYFQWIKNAVENKQGGKLYTYQEGNTLKGLIYLKEISDKTGSISLIGVDQGYRGEQIGSKLINKSMDYFNRLGKTEVQVVTQKANVLACDFYKKNRFEIMDTVNVYHLWV